MSLAERLDGATSVLLLAPLDDPSDDRACIDLLSGDDPACGNVLSVTITETPDDRLAVWRQHAGDTLPARVAVVGAEGSRSEDVEQAGITVDVLSDPTNPVELALAVGRQLERWDGTSEPTRLCIHSVTALLDALDRTRVADLITGLDHHLAQTSTVVHYHADPERHDAETIAALRPLVDAVAEYFPGEGWTVHTSDREPPFRRGGGASPAEPAATADPDPDPDPGLSRSLDTAAALLSSPRRRRLLSHLVEHPGERLPFDELVDRIVALESDSEDAAEPPSRRDVAISLHHAHLPKLDAVGVIEFDEEDRTVRYRSTPALEQCLEYMDGVERAD